MAYIITGVVGGFVFGKYAYGSAITTEKKEKAYKQRWESGTFERTRADGRAVTRPSGITRAIYRLKNDGRLLAKTPEKRF